MIPELVLSTAMQENEEADGAVVEYELDVGRKKLSQQEQKILTLTVRPRHRFPPACDSTERAVMDGKRTFWVRAEGPTSAASVLLLEYCRRKS